MFVRRRWKCVCDMRHKLRKNLRLLQAASAGYSARAFTLEPPSPRNHLRSSCFFDLRGGLIRAGPRRGAAPLRRLTWGVPAMANAFAIALVKGIGQDRQAHQS